MFYVLKWLIVIHQFCVPILIINFFYLMKGRSAYKVEKDGEPRNVILWILIIKYIVGCEMNKDRVIGGYDSTREGAKGDNPFIIFNLAHI